MFNISAILLILGGVLEVYGVYMMTHDKNEKSSHTQGAVMIFAGLIMQLITIGAVF